MPQLIVHSADGRRAEVALKDRPAWIGRSRENEVPIADGRASRKHCAVEPGQGAWWVVDNGSSNGTLLNGKLVERARLEPGDLIEIGSTRIWFDRVDDAAEATRTMIAPASPREERGRIDLLRLQRTARAVIRELDPQKLFGLILDHAIDTVQAERGFLLLRGEGPRVEIAASRSFSGDEVRVTELDISRSLCARVLQTGQAVCAVNAQEDERLRDVESISILGLRSVLAIPLRDRDEVLGALYLDNRLARRAFDSDDLRMLEALADQAAVAIRNARLFAQTEQSRREVEESRRRVEALNAQLEVIVRGQTVELENLREAVRARQALGTKHEYREIVGRSPAILQTLRLLDRVVESEVPVHICGESGTGKELVARAVHAYGPRRAGPFVSENCAALTETLLESELFGYVKGAFTGADKPRKGLFELAHKGTLFLDEVGDMSPGMQRKLLRVLQEGEVRPVGGVEPIKVDVRILSASNRDLAAMVETGEFREDLFYRLRVLHVRLPSLRERKEDIPVLVASFLDREAKRSGGRPLRLAPGVLESLLRYDWPGNVRELENECMRMTALATEVVEADVLSDQVRGYVPRGPDIGSPDDIRDLNVLVEQVEVGEIRKALALHGSNKTRAADALRISRFALQRKLEKYGIAAEGDDPAADPPAGT
ncbi:MAG: Anaerobic nitric oxide reductase transcription regulator NorR [Planctomycetes bacterium]|nr:Anaerobic nitric oxide reductase transcription regulator NorR [Planctomycetota bacterium]